MARSEHEQVVRQMQDNYELQFSDLEQRYASQREIQLQEHASELEQMRSAIAEDRAGVFHDVTEK